MVEFEKKTNKMRETEAHPAPGKIFLERSKKHKAFELFTL